MCISTGSQTVNRTVSVSLNGISDTAISELYILYRYYVLKCIHNISKAAWMKLLVVINFDHFIHAGGDDFDYLNTSINILGSPSQSICTEIVIEFDGRIEPMEMFLVQLRTDDTAVNLGLNETRISINDSDGMYRSYIVMRA